jgi:hypothetical protein
MHGNITPVPLGQAAPQSNCEGATNNARHTLTEKIKVCIEKAAHYEKKAEEFYITAGQYIKDVKALWPDRWLAIVEEDCGLKRSRAYEILAIADGRTTLHKVRSGNAQSKRHSRDNAKQASPGRPGFVEPANGSGGADPELSSLAWADASTDEQRRFVSAIGMKPLLAAIPEAWWPLIEQHIADRHRAPIEIVPVSDEIPPFLRREVPAPAAAAPNAGTEIALIDDPEYEDDEDREYAEFEERRAKRERNIKLVERTDKIASSIGDAFGDLEELAGECREVVDNAEGGLRETQRIQTLEASADELGALEVPDVPAALAELPVTYSLPKRRYVSRVARATDAGTILYACVDALEGIAEGDERHADAQELSAALHSAIDSVGCCEFPGMYG